MKVIPNVATVTATLSLCIFSSLALGQSVIQPAPEPSITTAIAEPLYSFIDQAGDDQNGWTLGGSIALKSTVIINSDRQLLTREDIEYINLTINNPFASGGAVSFELADLSNIDGVTYDNTGIYLSMADFSRFIFKIDNGIDPWEQTAWITQIYNDQPLSRYYSRSFNQNGTNNTIRWFGETQRASDFEFTIASVTLIPEPTSTALLSLGGVAVMMRRRR